MSTPETALSTEIITSPRAARRPRFLSLLTEEYRLRIHKSGELAVDLLFALLAAALSCCHALFGVYPFSIALLCAVRRRAIPVLIGAAVGCYFLGAAGLLYLCLLLAVFGLRILISYPGRRRFLPRSGGLFAEEPSLSICLALLVGLFMAVYELILGGFHTHTLLFALGSILLPATSCFLFLGVFASSVGYRALLGREGATMDFGRVSPVHFQIGALLLLFAATLSLRELAFFGLSLRYALASVLVLITARRFGALRGCAVGLLLGLAGELAYLPCFAILGLLFGTCFSIGMPCALSASVVAAGGYAVYVGGLSGFLAVIPEMAVTSLLAWPYLRTLKRAEPDFFKRASITVATAPVQASPLPDEPPHPSALFLSLASALHRAADGDRVPEREEYGEMCATVKERYCRRCPRCAVGEERAPVCLAVDSAIAEMGDRLHRGEEGATEPVGNATAECEAFGRMREEIRSAAQVLIKRHRRRSSADVFSTDYSLVARVLDEMSEHRRAEDTEDATASQALAEALHEAGIRAEEVRVSGKRNRSVLIRGVSWEGGEHLGHRIREIGERVLGISLLPPTVSFDGKRASCRLDSRARLALRRATASLAKNEGEPIGDAVSVFEDADGLGCALLSDGMGSGPRAARTAELCVCFLTELLRAGVSHGTALRMLNNTVSGGKENGATVDLFRLDPQNGRAIFVKSGAAVSFVARGDQLFRVRARTVPIGLLKTPDAEEIRFDAEEGDLIIMLSDGAVHGREDGGRIKELVASCGGDPELLASRILSAARAESDETDDVTVLVLKVVAA